MNSYQRVKKDEKIEGVEQPALFALPKADQEVKWRVISQEDKKREIVKDKRRDQGLEGQAQGKEGGQAQEVSKCRILCYLSVVEVAVTAQMSSRAVLSQ